MGNIFPGFFAPEEGASEWSVAFLESCCMAITKSMKGMLECFQFKSHLRHVLISSVIFNMRIILFQPALQGCCIAL